MSDAEVHPPPPREPEIEFLGKCARIVLRVLRGVLWLAGLAAITYGCCKALDPEFRLWFLPPAPDGSEQPSAGASAGVLSALGMVWLTVGLPLVCRADWLLDKGRGVPIVLGLSAVLWFAPMLLADDSPYGFILRPVATLIAFLCVFVWRTLWRLTPVPEGGVATMAR